MADGINLPNPRERVSIPPLAPPPVADTRPQPEYVGYGLYFDPTTRVYVVPTTDANGTTYWAAADPVDVARLEKAMEDAATAGGGGAAGADPRLIDLQIAAEQAQIEATRGEEARAQELQPLNVALAQQKLTLDQAEEDRAVLSDRFERAKEAFSASYLAEQLADEKKKTAVTMIRDLAELMVPESMVGGYWPGMEPGGPAAAVFQQAGLPYTPTQIEPVARVNFGALQGGLSPTTDAALQYVMEQERQNRGQ